MLTLVPQLFTDLLVGNYVTLNPYQQGTNFGAGAPISKRLGGSRRFQASRAPARENRRRMRRISIEWQRAQLCAASREVRRSASQQ